MSTLNIAHRGASADAPENTLAAFELAVEQGAQMIETDLHLSRDGEIPIYHDDQIEGTPVGELTLAELREIRPELPTLQQMLDKLGGRIPLNLEIKRPRKAAYEGLEAQVLSEVKRRGLLPETLFSCFHDGVLATLRGLEPAARVGLLISARFPASIEERASALAAEAIHPPLSLAQQNLVESAHARGLRVNVYTVDAPDDQRRLIALGVDGIFTNLPAQLSKILAG